MQMHLHRGSQCRKQRAGLIQLFGVLETVQSKEDEQQRSYKKVCIQYAALTNGMLRSDMKTATAVTNKTI